MKGTIKNLIIAVVIIVVLLIPIILNYFQNRGVKVIAYNDYSDLISGGDFALVYYGDPNNSNYDEIESNLTDVKSTYDITVKTLDKTSLSEAEINDLVANNSSFSEDELYLVINDSELESVQKLPINLDRLKVITDMYYNHNISEADIAYKTISTSKEYKKIVDGKKITMSVFGRESCPWCNKFKPIYNDLAGEYKLDIYYLDSDNLNKDEYSKILNSGLTIPASCSSTGVEVSLATSFGTPLTLFTKNGKTIGCISGYLNKTNLTAKLKSVGMIK